MMIHAEDADIASGTVMSARRLHDSAVLAYAEHCEPVRTPKYKNDTAA